MPYMTNDLNPLQCSYTTLVSGDASFFGDVGVPLAHALEMDLRDSGIYRHDGALDDALKMSGEATNALSLIAGVVGITLYIGKKVLDDAYTATIHPIVKKVLENVYATKIQPIVKRVLGQTDDKLTHANSRYKKVYQLGLWYEQDRVLVLAAIVGDSFSDILKHQDLLPTIHVKAVTWIMENGRQKAIHFYIVEGGVVNAAPMLFDTLIEAHSHLVSRYPFNRKLL